MYVYRNKFYLTLREPLQNVQKIFYEVSRPIWNNSRIY